MQGIMKSRGAFYKKIKLEVVMKKLIVAVLVVIGMMSMVGCSDTPKIAERMYIEPAQLQRKKKRLLHCWG